MNNDSEAMPVRNQEASVVQAVPIMKLHSAQAPWKNIKQMNQDACSKRKQINEVHEQDASEN